ncbi:MAG: carbon-nitrogen hydrolase [Paramuribaculum sp.]|nr:carbon-nitrogen hydrolase [Paramuribaculum sp.]
MKPPLELGIIQQSKTADISDNRRKLADAVARLADKGAKLIVNQELHDTLYFCQTESVECFDLATDIKQGNEAYDFYADLAKRHNIVLVVSLFERRAPGLCHNTAIVFETDGSEAGRYRKMHIPDDPAYYEKFYFTPGDLGFKPIATSVGRLGLLVCWDQWFPEAARLMALAGAELLIYPTAIGWESTDTPDEQERQRQAWMTIQRGHAVANGLPVVTVNRVGHEADPSGTTGGIQFWGSSFIAGPQGELIFEAPTDQECEQIISVDMHRSEQVRRWWPFLRDRRIDAYDGLLRRYIGTE